ncbi:MAG: hypothetical protein ACREV1_08835 [Gammaproteobacteria bacterium]
MKTRMGTQCGALISGILLLTPLVAVAGGPVGATLQTQGNAGAAAALESGFGLTESALISVVVTRQNSRPATNFGSDVGDGSAAITLPTGWSLTSTFNLPAGGCAMMPTQFDNVGSGVYTIRVAADAACPWVAGEYHYAVGLNKDVKIGHDKINFRGTTLGSVVIP